MTDTITHHLTDDLLARYCAGELSEGFSLAVATHLSLCDACRARAEALDAVGGAVLDATPPAPLARGALDRALAGLDERPSPAAPPPRCGGVLPAPLRDYAGGEVDSLRWRNMGPGVESLLLIDAPEGSARLFRIRGGSELPDHGHRGTELTLVLSGAFRDGDARFARGDVEIADETMQHTPIAEPGAPCICLAVTEGRLRFRGLLPRLAQPFFGV
ncbi:transcriptional regulator [Mesobaculum littorinae]|uniref:Transcriptional regulator n=1 Tax=Mesobaculum littorinae TaxID=2486419 RepID=A0A438AHH8_9RHOB|nr:ChrR family anti-sigma-E factor [Mesobaculum littorinae]RVV98189.1 transcriptional regulator [Mesobaculum littorinae]